MTARAVVANLLEADPDEVDPRSELGRYAKTWDFDKGVDDIVRDARELYERLVADGTISTMQRHASGLGGQGYDPESVAQAILKRAIERRGSRGAVNAYKAMKRLNYYNF